MKKIDKYFSLLILIILILTFNTESSPQNNFNNPDLYGNDFKPNYSNTNPLFWDEWGTLLGAYNGVTLYSNGNWEWHPGEYNEVNGFRTGIKWQCVEFVNRYYTIVYKKNLYYTGIYGDAKDYFNKASSAELTAYPNSCPILPKVGDILCFDGYSNGHVAIIREVAPTEVHVIHQNWSNSHADNDKIISMNNSNGIYSLTSLFDSNNHEYYIEGWLRIPQNESIDISLVLDRSGSMGTYGYMQSAQTAASTFVGFMQTGDNVAVASFNSYSRVDFPLTTIESEATKTAAQNSINGLISGGATSIGAGIQAGQGELDKGNTQIHQAMVLLSDGYENSSPYVADILPTIPENTDIYIIALGSHSDEKLLQDIAIETGGTYNYAPTEDELRELYLYIRAQVTGEQVIASYNGTISQGATQQHLASVDGSTYEVTFSVAFEGSDVDLELRTPTGNLINPTAADTDPNITYIEGATYDYYRINSPIPGQWTLIIKGIDLPVPEHYTASVFGSSNLKMETYFGKDKYTTVEPILIHAKIQENGQPVTGSMVTAEVTTPSSSFDVRYHAAKNNNFDEETTINDSNDLLENKSGAHYLLDTINLYDDGAHGDGAANDGIYANYYGNTSTDGSYNITVHASGTAPVGGQFTRQSILSTFVEKAVGPTTITVTYPNGGEMWYVGNGYDIYWTSDNYVGQVMIEISTTGGNSWWDVTEGRYSDNDGKYFYWPNSNNISGNCLFRVTSIENRSVRDQSDAVFTIADPGSNKHYTAIHIPTGVSEPAIDGELNDAAWSYANGPEILQRGGVPDDYLVPWSNFSDNRVTWRAVWSKNTNLLYIAIEVEDDIAGVSDNDYDYFWMDDCIELFTDGDKSGGEFINDYVEAQQWMIRRDNARQLLSMPGPYNGSAITSSVKHGANGNWVLEAAMVIYDHYPTDIKYLNENDVIGWEVWYDDSDNTYKENNKWARDHQVGWGYTGPAYENADAFHELTFGQSPNEPLPDVYYAKKIPNTMSVPTLDGILDEPMWSIVNEDSLLFGDNWGQIWSNYNNNLVTWRSVWSDQTNKLYVAVKVIDDIRGTFDNNDPNYSPYRPWYDDSIEFYTDGNHNGGNYSGRYDIAQQWRVSGENNRNLNNYPSATHTNFYTGQDFITAISTYPQTGNWTCEAAFTIYNNYPTDVKILSIGSIIGWEMWYADSDDKNWKGDCYGNDHFTGWLFSGDASSNADHFGDIVLDAELQNFSTYFFDDFEDGNSDGWVQLNSNRWSVVQDEGDYSYFLHTSNYSGDEYSLIENHFFNDFELNLKVKSNENLNQSQTANCAILFGYQDVDNNYFLKLCHLDEENKLYRDINGQGIELATYNGPTIKDNSYHDVRLIREAGNIKVYFDNLLIMNVNDNTFPAGKIAVGAYKYSAFFDDVLVTKVGGLDKITVTSPNGGERWQTNVPQQISWTSNGITGQVKIEISTNNGASWTIIAPNVDNTGNYSWTPSPTYISKNCLIRITSLSNNTVFDLSDAEFTIESGDEVNLWIKTDHTGPQNGTVTIPIHCGDVSGFAIYSSGLAISYDPNVLQAVDTDITGTMLASSGWNTPIKNITTGKINIAMAGNTPLTGTGILVNIIFNVIGTTGTTSPINFDSASFNEGNPLAKTSNGFLRVIEGNYKISGNIFYYNNQTIAIPDVIIQLMGNMSQNVSSDAKGFYELLNLSVSDYTITPQKAADYKSAITPYDAALVLRSTVGTTTLTPYQKIAGDVSGNNDVSALDASYILRRYVGLINNFPCGSEWAFVPEDFSITNSNWFNAPGSRTYSQLNSDHINQDFLGILIGDVSGNWDNSSENNANSHVELGIGKIQKKKTGEWLIPLEISYSDVAYSCSFKLNINNHNLIFASTHFDSPTLKDVIYAVSPCMNGVILALASAETLNDAVTINLLFKEKNLVNISSLDFDFDDVIVDDQNSLVTVVRDESKIQIPENWSLSQNHPNPFNNTTSISYEVPKSTNVTIEIFNLLGQRIKTLMNEIKEPGKYLIHWNGIDENGKSVGSGIYLYKMRSENFNAINKMVLVR